MNFEAQNDISAPGYVLPWDLNREKVFLAPGDVSLWTGIARHRKSLAISEVALSIIQQGGRVCIANLETDMENFFYRIARQALASTTPKAAELRANFQWMLGDSLSVFNLFGDNKEKHLLEKFKESAQKYGVTTFIIDSITALNVKNKKSFIEKLCKFKDEYNCHIHLVTHPRKLYSEDRIMGKNNIDSLGLIAEFADNFFIVWRNKKKEDINDEALIKTEENINVEDIMLQPDSVIRCVKQKNKEWDGKIKLWFDQDSLRHIEQQGSKPRPYFEII